MSLDVPCILTVSPLTSFRTDFRKAVETGMDPCLALALVFFCAAVFCVIATSFPLGQVSYAVLVCFTVRQKIVSRRIYVNFTV